MKITAVIPTRGLVFARTLISLEANGIYRPIIVDGLPLPDAHNQAIKRAMEELNDYILMVEDDVELPLEIIPEMLEMDLPVVALDYPINDNQVRSVTYRKGKLVHVSFGCTLFKRDVFRQMPYPWFENDNALDARTWEPLNRPIKYGGHDIWFSYKLMKMGIPFGVVPNQQAQHLRCKELNRIISNQGAYTIRALPKID